MKKIKNIFSYSGKIGRVDFLLYGLVLPFIIYLSFNYISIYMQSSIVWLIGFLLAFYIAIVSALKRANEASWNTIVLMLLYLIIPTIGVLFLLFQGEPVRNKFYIKREDSIS